MTYIFYCYIVTPATKVPMGGIGVFWLLSTPAQLFTKYEVWYCFTRMLGISLPCSNMQYCGLVDQVFPKVQTVEQLIALFRMGIEVWAGTNIESACVDMYHRTVIAGAAIYPRWAHRRLTDFGTDPANWIWARHCKFVGIYDFMQPVAAPTKARL